MKSNPQNSSRFPKSTFLAFVYFNSRAQTGRSA